jgi:hypothetical protein
MTRLTRLTRLTLRLARNPDAGFPDGAPDRGYVVVAPLDGEHMLDPALWHDNKAQCTVHRFSPVSGESAQGFLTHHGSRWRFAWDDADEGPDDEGLNLATHRLEPLAYVTMTSPLAGSPDGTGARPLVFQITEATKL